MSGTLDKKVQEIFDKRRQETFSRIAEENPEYIRVTKYGVERLLKPHIKNIQDVKIFYPNFVYDEKNQIFWHSQELYEKHQNYVKEMDVKNKKMPDSDFEY